MVLLWIVLGFIGLGLIGVTVLGGLLAMGAAGIDEGRDRDRRD